MSGPQPASGDPFAAAYAKNGNAWGVANTGKTFLGKAARPQAGAPGQPPQAGDPSTNGGGPYQGYGFPLTGRECPPVPGAALEECVRAAQFLLSDTI